jgi:hypothetical protein
MKKILAYIFVGQYFNHQHIFREMFLNINKEFDNFVIIDLSYLINKTKENYKYIGKNFLIPKTYFEFESFLLNHKVISFISLGKEFKYFKILRLLKKNDVRLIQNNSIGVSKKLKIYNMKKFLKKKFSFFFFRFLVLINYLPRIDLLFETSKESISNINNQLGRKISKIAKILDIAYIKDIQHVNFRAYESNINNLHEISEKYIVFLDGGYDHPDVIMHEQKQSAENRKKYYYYLDKILNLLAKFYNKKVIFCAHPKVNENQIKKFFKSKKIKIVKFKTKYFILRAFLVIMHESSSVFDALILKKRIINLNSTLMGRFYYDRNKFFPERVNIPSYIMEDYQRIEKSSIDKYFLNKTNLYDNYLKNFVTNLSDYKKIFFKKSKGIDHNKFSNLPGSIQMLRIINKKFF